MYKMLIVDDEPRQLRALAHIVRSLRPDFEVYEANDGQMALKLLKERDADIIMTDIRMPVMDGMQFIEELSSRNHPARVILLTGHGEFEYAQKAIRLGVFDYIVKPVSKQGLEQLLQKLERSLERKSKEQEFLSVYQAHLLNKWILGEVKERELEELGKIIPLSGIGTIGVIEVIITTKESPSPSVIESRYRSRINAYLKALTEEVDEAAFTFFIREGDKSKIVFHMNALEMPKHPSKWQADMSNRLCKWMELTMMEGEAQLTIGISILAENVFQQASLYFEQAQAALNRKFFHGFGKVLVYGQVEGKSTAGYDLSDKQQLLASAMKKLNAGTVNETVNLLFEQVSQMNHVQPTAIKEDFVHLTLQLAQMVKHLIPEESFSFMIEEFRAKLMSSSDYKELRHRTKHALAEIMNRYRDSDKDPTVTVVEQCQSYIDEHYAEELSLEQLSQKFHFHPSYFSTLFKHHMGIGLSDYVLKVRMQEARQMLLQSNCKMSELAQKVGYKDASYFIRIFKREWGVSPLKLRHGSTKDKG